MQTGLLIILALNQVNVRVKINNIIGKMNIQQIVTVSF